MRFGGFTKTHPAEQRAKAEEHEQDFMNKVTREENEAWRNSHQRGRGQRSKVSQLVSQTEYQPDDPQPEQYCDHAYGVGIQTILAFEQAADGGGDPAEVVERGSVVVAGIVVVIAGAEQRGHEESVHAFVVMQDLHGKLVGAHDRRAQKNGGRRPLPRVKSQKSSGCRDLGLRLGQRWLSDGCLDSPARWSPCGGSRVFAHSCWYSPSRSKAFQPLLSQAQSHINQFLAHITSVSNSVVDGHGADLIPAERNHAAEICVVHHID